jgi:hypothetical protein
MSPTASRWDWLYDLKARPIGDYLLDRLAEELARDIKEFPPAVDEWHSEEDRRRLQPLLASGRIPSEMAIRTAIWLAQADLRREVEAVDQFMRAGGLDERLGDAEDRQLCRFLWQYLEDKVLAFAEATQSRFRRAELADTLARLERRLFGVTLA